MATSSCTISEHCVKVETWGRFRRMNGWIQDEGTLKRLNLDALYEYQKQESPHSVDKLEATIDETVVEDWYCTVYCHP